jgi:hypothetical protein
MKKVFLLLVLVNVGYSIFSQELWNGTRYGMSRADVKKLHPSSSAPTKPRTLTLYEGAGELLRLNDIKIHGYRFYVSFFFKNDILVQVTLTPDDEYTKNTSKIIGEGLFSLLKRLLTAKYGREIIVEETTFLEKTTSGKLMIWMSGGTNITLSYVSFPDLYFLDVQYQMLITEEMKKL